MRDSAERFNELGAIILGASFDTPAENLAFARAQAFPFRLLSDLDHTVGTAYQVTRDPDDKFADFPRRHSFLIDPESRIHRSYDVTDVVRHADQVISDIEQAQQSR